MKLSSKTVSILKNFSSINSNIVFSEGSTVKTMSNAKNILSSADISETFENGFGIYDLNEFLNVIGMFEDPEFIFNTDMKYVTINQGRQSIKYFFSDTSILTSPSKDIKMPSTDVEFVLSNEDLNSLRKSSAVLGTTDIVVKGTSGSSSLTLLSTDIANKTANSYKLDIDSDLEYDNDFELVFNINNFKFVQGDYKVSISSKLISKFENTADQLTYWVALEKSSKFNV